MSGRRFCHPHPPLIWALVLNPPTPQVAGTERERARICVTALSFRTCAVRISGSALLASDRVCSPVFFPSRAPLTAWTAFALCRKRCLCPKSLCASTDTFLGHKEIRRGWGQGGQRSDARSTWNSRSKLGNQDPPSSSRSKCKTRPGLVFAVRVGI